ncbi:FAD binding domain-containing protein [Ampelomyces quisqualis]|uniref:FAD binding domain-containing protein n=1 Tax=Ampelomyces quisqualis TaxID=50730 RepID=A0A6A5QLA8_AMPQU|nr:FAD binding domain-containing protein [Ampelomyces quisqualis]
MVVELFESLLPKLSRGATITTDPLSRWSTYKAPNAAVTVNVTSELDVATTVRFCNEHGFTFLAQNGGSGWATFPGTKDLVIINLSNLNSVVLAADKTTAVIGGGARVYETITAADSADVLVLTGNCNGVGVLGALLGGGYGNLMGKIGGMGVDSILELRAVTADGAMRTINASQEPDLFWAMRGAGPNFGVVTSATVKACPTQKDKRIAWSGALIYTEDKLEQVVEAIQNIELIPHAVCFMYYGSSGPSNHVPVIIVTLWLFQGTPESGKASFKPLFDIGPVMDTTSILPYTEWNTSANPFCTHAERKPVFTAGLDKLDPKAWREVWNKYVEFQKLPTAHASAVLLEAYPNIELDAARTPLASFPHRAVRFQAAILTWYTDEQLDKAAVKCGKEIREVWRKSNGRDFNASYVNFAHGDEPLEEIYGDSLPRLRELKRKWDPEDRFNQWFNIQ